MQKDRIFEEPEILTEKYPELWVYSDQGEPVRLLGDEYEVLEWDKPPEPAIVRECPECHATYLATGITHCPRCKVELLPEREA
jgi:hypothetical protein